MYDKAYKNADQLANDILQGKYQRAPAKKRGIAEKAPSKPAEQAPEEYALENDLMMQYFLSIRQQNQAMGRANEWGLGERTRGSGGSGEGSGDYTPFAALDGDVGAAVEALGYIESSGNWQAKGPPVPKGTYKGQRAIGKFQVMEGNIGPWTREILGRSYTTDEFINDKAAQYKVASTRMQQAYDKHGTWEDAASVWFSGGPISTNSSRSDGYNTVPQYVSKFQSALKRYNT